MINLERQNASEKVNEYCTLHCLRSLLLGKCCNFLPKKLCFGNPYRLKFHKPEFQIGEILYTTYCVFVLLFSKLGHKFKSVGSVQLLNVLTLLRFVNIEISFWKDLFTSLMPLQILFFEAKKLKNNIRETRKNIQFLFFLLSPPSSIFSKWGKGHKAFHLGPTHAHC